MNQDQDKSDAPKARNRHEKRAFQAIARRAKRRAFRASVRKIKREA